MGEAQILLRSDSDAARSETGEVERKLSAFGFAWNEGFVRKAVIILCLAAGVGGLWHVPRQPAVVPDLPRHRHDACSIG